MVHRPAGILTAVLFCFITLGAGCARMQTYEVMVINDADAPVTAWMSKAGRPAEMHWLSPADFAIVYDPSQEAQIRLPSAVLAPGERVRFGPREGEFPKGATAVVDVFEGAMPLSEMISLSRRSPRRAQVVLAPGSNLVRVTSADPVTLQRQQTP